MADRVEHIELPPAAKKALRLLESDGCEAWCVGGFVRDELMGCPTHDVDIATNAHWRLVERIFASHGFRTFETGVTFGTLTVIVDDASFEITTYRADSAYSDARHPDAVEFISTIDDDLARRDFTMNAIAYHPDRGMRDPFGGRNDIRAGIIRTVGDAHARFGEDALRILRAMRFLSQLGFSLERKTEEAMHETAQTLSTLPVERTARELDGMLLGSHPHAAIMTCIDVIGSVIPELLPLKDLNQRTPYHLYDALEHTAYVVQHCPDYRLVRWAALLHDIGKPSCFTVDAKGRGHFFGHPAAGAQMARSLMKRLKLPPRFADDVAAIIAFHDAPIAPNAMAVKRCLRELGGRIDLFRALVDLKIADALSQTPGVSDHLDIARELPGILDEILTSGDAYAVDMLAINGNDLLELGIPEGERIGQVLRAALAEVIEGRIPNDRDRLKSFAQAWEQRRR